MLSKNAAALFPGGMLQTNFQTMHKRKKMYWKKYSIFWYAKNLNDFMMQRRSSLRMVLK